MKILAYQTVNICTILDDFLKSNVKHQNSQHKIIDVKIMIIYGSSIYKLF